MKHTRRIIVFTLLVAFGSSAFSQDIDKIIRPRKRQTPALYLKAYYLSPSINMVNAIRADITYGETLGVIRNINIGLSYRIPIYRFIYIQPEAIYGFATDWNDAFQSRDNFFPRIGYAFEHRLYSSFDFPIHIGARWCPSKLFAARAYLGPVFNFTLAKKDFRYTPGYVFSTGVGLDLLNILSVDAGYRIGMYNLTIYNETAHFFLATSIKF